MRVGRFDLDNPLALAPMCSVTDLAMRRLARREGAALCFTQMVSAEGLLQGSEKTEDLLRSAPDDRPLGVQIFGGTPARLAQAARYICDTHGVQWIDLNMGCPVRKVACREAGSGLLKDLPLVREIWLALRDALPNENFSVKVRAGWDANSLVVDELAALADEVGIDAITLHPRTRKQGYSGKADWSLIGRLKAKTRAAVFGSGDLFTPRDVVTMMKQTGADGAFLARGATGNPWIFSRTLALLEGRADPGGQSNEQLFETIRDHLRGLVELFGDHVASTLFRRHLAEYVKGRPCAARMRARVFTLSDPREIEGALEAFLLRGEISQPDRQVA